MTSSTLSSLTSSPVLSIWSPPDTPNTSVTSAGSPQSSTFAFAFDIDGVLVRSKEALPGATETLQMLQQRNIPFIFLTNGGGSTEKHHVSLLAQRLGMPSLHERQFVQSHSPFHGLVPEFQDKNILVLGGVGDSIRNVAEAYGFRKVITSADIVKTFGEHVYPFLELEDQHHEEHGRLIEHRMPDGRVQISAILVWSSPRSWGLDLQLTMDLLLSEKGVFGTFSPRNGDVKLPNQGYLQDEQPKIFFSNPDQTWATAFHLPRVAQGSWRYALQGIWDAQTNKADLGLAVTTYGKPVEATYIYAEQVLQKWHKEIHGLDAPPIRNVYMVGDNPGSDIKGANDFQSRQGSEWKSILVESGIYAKGTTPASEPDHIVSGVKDAVNLATWMETECWGSD
ncbi:hypothetical protein QTJ16_002121 [Diplocarpon rosae]|uniref:HAD-superfamily hydrolase n=1 Tax=Diplocarpon rosae TaxID=946125 RepID=A0AAD9T2T7_9HELO|nr:hypothetical protein QTJ16_002121 [Diplocarpon rosae]